MAPESQSGGGSQELSARVGALEQAVQGLSAMLAEKLGIGNVTQSTAVTEAGYAADARQLNAALPGTLAHSVGQAQGRLLWKRQEFIEIGNEKGGDGERVATYRLSLAGCQEVCLRIYAKGYSPLFHKVLPVAGTTPYESIYVVDNNGYAWAGHVAVSGNEVSLHTYKNSTNIDSNYFQLMDAWAR